MNFSELYKNNRKAVERALVAMWCGESNNDSQRSYIKQMKSIIGDLFAPKNAVPVVQCMNSYEPVHSVKSEEAIAIVGDIWDKAQPKDPAKKYPPYEHQYKCWDALLNQKTEEGKPKSIVVTTGTGSGKTECFMMPLVHDLTLHAISGEIQALFLYPLNALMEDQKERLEQLLEGTNLTYTVYNGDLPEMEPKDTDRSDDAEKMRRRIEQITGGKYSFYKPDPNEKGHYVLENIKYSHMVYTRQLVRKNPPNILLTNPTMLEYVLLRGTDAKLINAGKKSLTWVAIDETHSYTGAGAAELAMLLRRVLLAFDVDAHDVHFATSSATFGNGEDKEKDEKELKEFIAGITGVDTKQIEAVGGVRIGEKEIPHGEDEERWKTIFNKDFVSLDELYPGDASISEKLQWLDEMCQREDDRYKAAGKKVPDMKLKVHYFYRVPNNGLFVRLDEFAEGSFKIYTENAIGKKIEVNHGIAPVEEAPLLELSRCKHCGEYVALAMVDTSPSNKDGWPYEAIATDDSDMFDLEEADNDESDKKYFIFGLSKGKSERGDNNSNFRLLPGGKLQALTPEEMANNEEWHVVGNTQCCCPYCNTKQTKKHDTDKDVEGDANGNMEDNRLQKFRLSADFISRMMASSILDQLDKGKSKTDSIVLHDGQQYISFVDSRQAAAKATLKQNLEQERMWFNSTIYHELCRRKANGLTKDAAMAQIMAAVQADPMSMMKYAPMMSNLQSPDPKVVQKQLDEMSCQYMTWSEIAELIKNDPYCPVFCSVFVKRSGDSDEIEDGLPSEEIIEKYVQSIMVMYLAHRPASSASPETMGLFETYYPQLDKITIPDAVNEFNDILENAQNRITEEDWRNLMQVYLDYTVRNNQSFYLHIPGNEKLDIFSTVRFATEKPRRRPFNKPKLEEGKVSQARIVRYLCALISRDDPSLTINDAQRQYFHEISNVIDALWQTLTGDEYKIMQVGERLNDAGKFVQEKDGAPRFNLNDLCFKLYDDVYLCDTKSDENRHAVCLRPIGNNFKRFSPYLEGSTPIELNEDLHEKWEPFPYYVGSGKEIDKAGIDEWAKTHRSLLWNNHIWGEDGVFYDRLEDIHLFPNLFVQQEHTAQVDKSVARGLQSKFKDHTINILACSTTMEMGVDLGNLEVVMLSSVPPQPSNYKQRAGRSGRNNKVRSACITLCGSDVIGLRTLTNPIEKIISRPVRVPTVDLMSPQVVQRHVNSFLIRSFGVFTDGANGGSLGQKVADYYTNFEIKVSNGKLVVLNGSSVADPNDILGDPTGTMYEKFNQMCAKPLESGVRKDLTSLLKDTIYDGQLTQVVKNAQEANDRCYSELRNKLVDYKTAFSGNGPIKDGFRIKLNMQYTEVLRQKLLNYWATSRFTPNANMPVNVLTLDLNSSSKKSFFTPLTSSNPSYSLRDAIAQYAPGNCVAVDGVVYTVRGIEVTNMYDKNHKAYKSIYRNDDKTAIDDPNLSNQMKWSVNDNYGLTLIQPAGFLPDMNEDKTRIMDSNAFTRVSAQLIDADDWGNNVTEPHLFSVRPNSDSGNAKILYYNEGRGFGYCYCPYCGRTVLETDVADPSEPHKFPFEFNSIVKHKEDQPDKHYHLALTGNELGKVCGCSNLTDKVQRNVIIGDLIQTDYSEIRIRHKNKKKWMSNRDEEETLLFTLGIVFTQALVDILGKERGAVDFAIMPNGHICVFDCNPGGAGYANQMANMQVMKDVIKASKKLLTEALNKKSKDMLLDKFTLRFIKYVDIQAALDWINEEEEVGDTCPQEIKDAFPGATPTQTTLYDLEKAFAGSHQELVLFSDNYYRAWDYDDKENGWRPQFMNNFVLKGQTTTFCVMESEDATMPDPVMSMVREISAWTKADKPKIMKNPLQEHGLYPLAYIDGNLYFTSSKEHSQLNVQWGNDTMFFVRTDNPITTAKTIDTSYKPSSKLLILSDEDSKEITTRQLGSLVQSKSDGLIDQFISYAKQDGSKLTITYQDEHLKSIMGMVLTIQTIEHIVKQIGSNFSIEYKVESYRDDRGNAESITANQPSSEKRDGWLTNLTNAWLDDLRCDDDIDGDLVPVESVAKRTLTHWRVLSIKCGNKQLSIYPDGGFINEWSIGYNKHLDVQTITYDTVINIFRNKEIKFDIIIEDC
jgi:hypothetical protein